MTIDLEAMGSCGIRLGPRMAAHPKFRLGLGVGAHPKFRLGPRVGAPPEFACSGVGSSMGAPPEYPTVMWSWNPGGPRI